MEGAFILAPPCTVYQFNFNFFLWRAGEKALISWSQKQQKRIVGIFAAANEESCNFDAFKHPASAKHFMDRFHRIIHFAQLVPHCTIKRKARYQEHSVKFHDAFLFGFSFVYFHVATLHPVPYSTRQLLADFAIQSRFDAKKKSN